MRSCRRLFIGAPRLNKTQTAGPLRIAGQTLLVLYFAAMAAGCAGILVGGAATSALVVNDERTTGTFIEDQAIELKAMDAISENGELKEQTHISVTSYNQIVLVTGQAPTDELRQAAISVVSQVEKVRHVYDEIEIAAPNSMVERGGDTVLTAKVKTKLFTLNKFDATKVKVVTENGVVFLMGILDREDTDAAAEAASTVSGVQKVVKLFEYVE
jgi:osmotically-inducible protein OsmY